MASIQAYLIYNTYELKKDAFINETRKAISRLDDETELIVRTSEAWGEVFADLLWQYRFEGLSKTQFLEDLRIQGDSLSSAFNALYQDELKKSNLDFEVKFKKNIYSIMVLDSTTIDTVAIYSTDRPLFILGEDFEESEGYTISQARWQTDYTAADVDGIDRMLEFRVHTKDRMNISEWQRIVLGRMATLLAGSVLLLLFVVGLFYYSIKNLIKQKKVADVKTDFINNITHELKTPLATLGIATKSLKNPEIRQSPDALENTLDILDRQNTRLQKLIDQVLTNSLGSEELTLKKEEVIDDEYVMNSIADFSLSVQHKNVALTTSIEPKKVLLKIDTFLFTTALFNILENAIKYGGESVTIHVATTLKDNKYEIQISDDGVGIPRAHLTSIFDKFYRVTSGNVHDVKGLGLGLYYTKQVIDAHQGTIAVESEPDRGTTFSITIPANS